MARTAARDVAMQLLYEAEMGGTGRFDTLNHLIELPQGQELTADDRAYIQRVLDGVQDDRTALDALLSACLREWTIERLARIDLCVLRLAAYEMTRMQAEVPRPVSVNEAVDLANRYSTDSAGAFVNGVLGTLLRSLEA